MQTVAMPDEDETFGSLERQSLLRHAEARAVAVTPLRLPLVLPAVFVYFNGETSWYFGIGRIEWTGAWIATCHFTLLGRDSSTKKGASDLPALLKMLPPRDYLAEDHLLLQVLCQFEKRDWSYGDLGSAAPNRCQRWRTVRGPTVHRLFAANQGCCASTMSLVSAERFDLARLRIAALSLEADYPRFAAACRLLDATRAALLHHTKLPLDLSHLVAHYAR